MKIKEKLNATMSVAEQMDRLVRTTDDLTRIIGRCGEELKRLGRRSKREKYLDSMISHLNAYHYNKKNRRHYFTKQIETTKRLIKRNQ
tara:strand:- start:379 stop:642 length:264 start_codon:yes stop_codon:yes gene_type:complete